MDDLGVPYFRKHGGFKLTLTPKCHFVAHIALILQWQNPATCWTYKQEPFMGYIVSLGHSCSHGTRAVRLSESFITKYALASQLKVNDMVKRPEKRLLARE